MKRILTGLLAAAVLFSLAGCARRPAPSSSPAGNPAPAPSQSLSDEEWEARMDELKENENKEIEMDFSLYEGYVEIGGDVYSIGDPLSKFVDNGWEPLPKPDGTVPYDLVYDDEDLASYSMELERDGNVVDVTVATYMQDLGTPVKDMMFDLIYVKPGNDWKLDTGMTSEDAWDTFPDFYSDAELKEDGETYGVTYMSLLEPIHHPWNSVSLDKEGNLHLFFNLESYWKATNTPGEVKEEE